MEREGGRAGGIRLNRGTEGVEGGALGLSRAGRMSVPRGALKVWGEVGWHVRRVVVLAS